MTPLEMLEAPAKKETVNISLRISGSNHSLSLPFGTDISDLASGVGASLVRRRTETTNFRVINPEKLRTKEGMASITNADQVAEPAVIVGPWQSSGRINPGCYELDQYDIQKLTDYISQNQSF